MVDLEDVCKFAMCIARQAGDVIVSAQSKRLSSVANALVEEKKNSVDLVTETDQAVEKLIKNAISERYPEHKFIGEESYAAGERYGLTDAPTWIVDPIDGTTNFVHGFPFVAVSIGFTVNSKPVMGVIYQPFLKNMFSAIAGGGAYLNGTQKLPLVSSFPPLSLNTSLLAVEWGSDRSVGTDDDNLTTKVETFFNLAAEPGPSRPLGRMVHSMRSLGSAACNLCEVAAGRLDGYWEGGSWEWDVAAGWVILSEAGGCIVNGNPQENIDEGDIMSRKYFAVRKAPRPEQEKFIRNFWDTIGGRKSLVYDR